eukprot:623691-Pyramimonas_sp.AAC.1
MKAQKKLYYTSYNKWMKATKAAKGGGGSKSQWKPSDWKGPAIPPDRAIEQPEAKLYIPPFTTIWRGNLGSGGWHVHCYEERKSRSWLEEGSCLGALLFVLRFAWKKHLGNLDLPLSACPIRGLFQDGPPELLAASGAAASSGAAAGSA